jgi:hypothetical protein
MHNTVASLGHLTQPEDGKGFTFSGISDTEVYAASDRIGPSCKLLLSLIALARRNLV